MKQPLPLRARLTSFIAWRLRPAWLASWFKRWIGVDLVSLQLDTGKMVVDPISNLGLRLIRDGYYEPELTAFFRSTLKAGDTFFDVGANEGFFSVLANTLVGPSGQIVSVEPQERLHSRLNTNFLANAMQNVRLFPVAISDHCGEAMIHLTPDMNSGASGLSQVTKYECETQKVELVTLSELVKRAQVDQIELMKMDIEGFEFEAILGSKELFRDHRVRCLAIELHPWLMEKRNLDSNLIVKFLLEQGYKHSQLGPVDIFQVDSPLDDSHSKHVQNSH